MIAPPPDPPRPGLSPPDGDMASEPLPPPGISTLEPGWDEITIPEPSLLPALLLGGAKPSRYLRGHRAGTFSAGAQIVEPEPIDGGGAHAAPSCGAWPRRQILRFKSGNPVCAWPPTDGAGGWTPMGEPGALPDGIDAGAHHRWWRRNDFSSERFARAPAALRSSCRANSGRRGTTLAARRHPVHRYENFLMHLRRKRLARRGNILGAEKLRCGAHGPIDCLLVWGAGELRLSTGRCCRSPDAADRGRIGGGWRDHGWCGQIELRIARRVAFGSRHWRSHDCDVVHLHSRAQTRCHVASGR